MSALLIRPLTLADLPQVDGMAVESVAQGFQFVARWRDALHASTTALHGSRQFFLGVFDGGELLAVGGVTPDPYDPQVDLGRIRHVYVMQAARRRGVGRQLLAALEERARNAYTALRLRTDTPEAAAFYESLGYARTTEEGATHRRSWRQELRS